MNIIKYYFTMRLSFTGKLKGQRKIKEQSVIVPHDIPLKDEGEHYHPKSVFLDTVVNNWINENDVSVEGQITVSLIYSADTDNGMKTVYPFNKLSHTFILGGPHVDDDRAMTRDGRG